MQLKSHIRVIWKGEIAATHRKLTKSDEIDVNVLSLLEIRHQTFEIRFGHAAKDAGVIDDVLHRRALAQHVELRRERRGVKGRDGAEVDGQGQGSSCQPMMEVGDPAPFVGRWSRRGVLEGARDGLEEERESGLVRGGFGEKEGSGGARRDDGLH